MLKSAELAFAGFGPMRLYGSTEWKSRKFPRPSAGEGAGPVQKFRLPPSIASVGIEEGQLVITGS